ncbi:Replication protein A 70 kDa DNA-binding subunit [Phytophthora cinnamomi]|uniref:Replication protein A 70 kDa DNA-binding subunit n=1 Tax=Phytophthora cinnamomi TaxID=4785 RepID=UPI00355A32EB|nr:Replication protein A 70 kDa DNA-binding subunit [Phytophthora cinnamomi]
MLNPIENCFSTIKAMVKRFLARHGQAILEVPPHRTIKEHREQYLLLTADQLLEEAITPGLCHRATSASKVAETTTPIEVKTPEDFSGAIGEKQPTTVQFSAPRCGGCKMVTPKVTQLTENGFLAVNS